MKLNETLNSGNESFSVHLIAGALAGFIFALGPGHNIPFLGSTPGTWKGILVLLAVILSAAFILVEASNVLSGYKINRSIYNE